MAVLSTLTVIVQLPFGASVPPLMPTLTPPFAPPVAVAVDPAVQLSVRFDGLSLVIWTDAPAGSGYVSVNATPVSVVVGFGFVTVIVSCTGTPTFVLVGENAFVIT